MLFQNLLATFPPAALSSSSCPKVLDVGCGLGGHSFLLAEQFGAEVTALDVCSNMLDIAKDRKEEQTEKVR